MKCLAHEVYSFWKLEESDLGKLGYCPHCFNYQNTRPEIQENFKKLYAENERLKMLCTVQKETIEHLEKKLKAKQNKK